jgi:twitching motility protein PilI
MNSSIEPFQALVDLAQRSLVSAQGLPAQLDIKPHWSGIGFMLAGHYFVAPMGEIAEIMVQPPSTRLPGVQPWVVGVSNVRGRLLPLIDLESFFGCVLGSRKARRVLALEFGDLYTGLIVSEVFGMQHIPVDSFRSEVPDTVSNISSFLAGSYQHNGVVWSVFSPYKLTQNAEFFNAAAS